MFISVVLGFLRAAMSRGARQLNIRKGADERLAARSRFGIKDRLVPNIKRMPAASTPAAVQDARGLALPLLLLDFRGVGLLHASRHH